MVMSIDQIIQIKQLHAEGYNKSQIARSMKVNWRTVDAWLKRELQTHRPMNKLSRNTPGKYFMPFIRKMLERELTEGIKFTGHAVYVALKKHNFLGRPAISERTIARLMTRVRQDLLFEQKNLK